MHGPTICMHTLINHGTHNGGIKERIYFILCLLPEWRLLVDVGDDCCVFTRNLSNFLHNSSLSFSFRRSLTKKPESGSQAVRTLAFGSSVMFRRHASLNTHTLFLPIEALVNFFCRQSSALLSRRLTVASLICSWLSAHQIICCSSPWMSSIHYTLGLKCRETTITYLLSRVRLSKAYSGPHYTL